MHQDLMVNLDEAIRKQAQADAHLHAERLLQVIGQTPPVYGHVEVTYLAGKLTKVEKRESFKP